MSRRTVSERLQGMEDNQIHFAEAIKKINEKLDSQDAKLDNLTATMNQITGGRKLLIWLAATATTLAGLFIAYLNGHQK